MAVGATSGIVVGGAVFTLPALYIMGVENQTNLFQLFFMFLMKVRMRQITFELEQGSTRVDLSDIELEALTRNVEAFKRLKI